MEVTESEEVEGQEQVDGEGQPHMDLDPQNQVGFESETDAEPQKYYVDNVAVSVANERVQYYGPDGKLITESLKDYTKTNIKKNFASLDDFILRWSSAEKKEELIKELAEQGILLEALREEVGKDMDAFDLVCHVAFDQPPLTRKERANNVRKRNYFAKYQGKAREVLDALLTKYENEGITTLESGTTLKVAPINQLGSPIELVRAFGKKEDFERAIEELEKELYRTA
jgi:type I restriction enzyme R subunit